MPTLGLALERNANRVPDREALVFGERRPVNPRSAPPELAYQLADSEAAALVFDPLLAFVVEAACRTEVPTHHFLSTRPLGRVGRPARPGGGGEPRTATGDRGGVGRCTDPLHIGDHR